MKLKKITKKLFKREMSLLETYTIISSIILGLFAIIKMNSNFVPKVFGVALLISVGIFIKNKEKNIVLLSIISVLGWLLVFSAVSPAFLTTTFSTGINDVPPSTLIECHAIDGIAMPITLECSSGFVETKGNAGEGYICCLPDTCQGEWKRVWNSETKIFEKICQ